MFAKKVSVYAGLERRERPNCISEKCIKCAPKRNVVSSSLAGGAKATQKALFLRVFCVVCFCFSYAVFH